MDLLQNIKDVISSLNTTPLELAAIIYILKESIRFIKYLVKKAFMIKGD